jgi:hypothetical protein
MLGCELEEAYPVVPIADRHALSIGVTTIKDVAFFGIYADRESLPDADVLAQGIGESIDELLALATRREGYGARTAATTGDGAHNGRDGAKPAKQSTEPLGERDGQSARRTGLRTDERKGSDPAGRP